MKSFLTPFAALLACALLASLPFTAAHAVRGAVDNAPGATLLLPYFETNLANPNGTQTALRLDNTSATAILTNVTLWTDLGVPTQTFNVYLVGYDSQTIDLRLLFQKGLIPVTASAGQDPTDTISPRGPNSQDINFASCNSSLPPALLPAATIAGLRAAHTGQSSSLFANQCAASPRSDNIARGYITIDAVNSCNTLNPTQAGYLGDAGVTTRQNVITGSYAILDRSQGTETGGPLVAVEATFVEPQFPAGTRTFYGSYNGLLATDQREPLGSTWFARYMNGGATSSRTLLTVWRDPGTTVLPFACGAALPSPFPLPTTNIGAFDEQEEFVEFVGTSPFPLATQRVSVASLTPFNFGKLFLNLSLPTGPGATQSYVQIERTSQGTMTGSTPALIYQRTSELQGCVAPCGIQLFQ